MAVIDWVEWVYMINEGMRFRIVISFFNFKLYLRVFDTYNLYVS